LNWPEFEAVHRQHTPGIVDQQFALRDQDQPPALADEQRLLEDVL
jgi:hypothetical protein